MGNNLIQHMKKDTVRQITKKILEYKNEIFICKTIFLYIANISN